MDRTIFRCLTAAAFVLLSACGAGAPRQDRPVIVRTYPAQDDALVGGLAELRIDYDEPVSVLNPNDVLVFADSFFIPVNVVQRAGEPNSVYLIPITGYYIFADAIVAVQVNEGLVKNAAGHYGNSQFLFSFSTGPEPDVPVGQPGQVTMLDPRVYTATVSRATPAGRDAVALLATTVGAVRRVWCQLDAGAGTGSALAYFDPADPPATPMDVIDLSGAGDLSAPAAALTIGARAQFIYAAYRNEATGGVRLFKIDADTAAEVDAFDLLSVTTGPGTTPAGLSLDETTRGLHICSHDGATGTLSYVDLVDFVEEDRDDTLAGTQGVTLPAGAGPITTGALRSVSGDPASADVTLVTQFEDVISTAGSTLVGTTVDVLRTRSAYLVLQPLAAFAGNEALQYRFAGDGYQSITALPVSDDIGGVAAGMTDSVAMVGLSAESRFLLLLDAPGGRILTSWTWGPAGFVQEDLDDGTSGVQAVDVSAIIPGATVLGRNIAEHPPVAP